MGLLSLGTPLKWEEAQKHANHVRFHGIQQFLNIWKRLQTRTKDLLLWGDEVEYMVIELNHKEKRVQLSLDALEALEKLVNMEKKAQEKGEVMDSSWKPEFGRYMLEGTPGLPYGSTLMDLLKVEENMVKRRQLGQSLLKSNQKLVSCTSFPLLGVEGTVNAKPTPMTGASRSLYVPDEVIHPHARFPTLVKNIQCRRGSKVSVNVPIFKDTHTPTPFLESIPASVQSLSKAELLDLAHWSNSYSPQDPIVPEHPQLLKDIVSDSLPDHIYLDSMAFGMGCGCLQITFQACSVEEARKLYDQLANISPLMMALSAASPIFKGYLADTDCRWYIIAGSVDDRSKEERGVLPLNKDRFQIPKSRYESVSSYLSPGPIYSGGCSKLTMKNGQRAVHGDYYKPEYNDLPLVYDTEIYNKLIEEGVDELLAKHYGHLFIRDPLVIYKELLDQDDQTSSDHFENIQSTNWQTMRFKPPPPNVNMGWRVEFRTMEVQRTDFENAAFAIFVVLLTRAILTFDLNFYLPLSKVDENMTRAQKRDAVLNEKFWFRTDTEQDDYEEMTLDDIFNGKVGLINIIRDYLMHMNTGVEEFDRLNVYLDLIRKRANGQEPTNAKWIRQFVDRHVDYQHDSVIPQSVCYDLLSHWS